MWYLNMLWRHASDIKFKRIASLAALQVNLESLVNSDNSFFYV